MLSLSTVVGCGGPRATSNTTPDANQSPQPAATAEPSGQIALRAEAEPPALTESDIAEDARNPEVVVSGDSPWVLIPSFRLGIQLPVGWYRSTSQQIVENLERTYGPEFAAMSEQERRDFEVALRAAVDRYPSDTQVMGLIPSVRVMLLPFGGVPPTDFCTAQSLPFSRQGYPEAQLVNSSWTEVHGRRAARCTTSMTANTVNGSFPAMQELLWIFGESHTVLILSLGNASDPVSATLDAVLGSIRRL